MLRRWESLSGAVGLGAVFVALFLPGPPPKTDDAVATLTAGLVEQRTALVDGMLLAGVGVMALLRFYGVLAARLTPREERASSFAVTAVAGGMLGIALMFVGMILVRRRCLPRREHGRCRARAQRGRHRQHGH